MAGKRNTAAAKAKGGQGDEPAGNERLAPFMGEGGEAAEAAAADAERAREEVAQVLTGYGYERSDDGAWSKDGVAIFREAAANDDDEPPLAPAPAMPAGFDAEHLTGQLGDFFLEQCKHARHLKPWDKMEQREQERLITRCWETARELVQTSALTIASKGLAHSALRVKSWNVQEGELKDPETGEVITAAPATDAPQQPAPAL